MKKHTILFISIVLLFIIIIFGIVLYYNLEKTKTEQRTTELKLDKERKKQNNLEQCVVEAENIRTNLWNSNCTKQSNGMCTIKTGSVTNWIEQRYQQKLDICYELYK